MGLQAAPVRQIDRMRRDVIDRGAAVVVRRAEWDPRRPVALRVANPGKRSSKDAFHHADAGVSASMSCSLAPASDDPTWNKAKRSSKDAFCQGVSAEYVVLVGSGIGSRCAVPGPPLPRDRVVILSALGVRKMCGWIVPNRDARMLDAQSDVCRTRLHRYRFEDEPHKHRRDPKRDRADPHRINASPTPTPVTRGAPSTGNERPPTQAQEAANCGRIGPVDPASCSARKQS